MISSCVFVPQTYTCVTSLGLQQDSLETEDSGLVPIVVEGFGAMLSFCCGVVAFEKEPI